MNSVRSAVVRADGEQLLELVDREHGAALAVELAGRAAELAQRVLAGADQRLRPVGASGQDSAGEGGQQAGPHDRRLAAARRADDREQRRADEPRDELGDELLAAEEVLGVLGAERREALVGADQRRAGLFLVACALAHGLQVGDGSGQLGLERPRLGAARGRAVGHGVDAARRLVPCPLPRDLVHAARHAAAGLEQGLDRHQVGPAGGGVEACDRPNGVGAERLERDRVARLEPGERRRLLPGGQDEHGQATERRRERPQVGAQIGRHAIGAVDHDQRRPPSGACARDRHRHAFRRSRTGGVDHRRALTVGLARQLGGEPGLAHPVRAGDRHQRARAGGRVQPVLPQPADVVVAADQQRRCVELGRELPDRRLDVERRVLAQDRVVQALQLGRRLDPDLVDQRPPGVAVGLQRLGLAPAPVQREHPLRVQPLAQRVLRQQRVDLADDLLVVAVGQVRVDRQLRGGQAQLLEPPDLRRRERLVGDVGQWIAAEQRERLARRPVHGLAGLGGPGRLGDEPFEAADVDELAVDP